MAPRCEQRTLFAVVMMAARFCRCTRDATSRGEGGIGDECEMHVGQRPWMDGYTDGTCSFIYLHVRSTDTCRCLWPFFLGQPPASQLAGKTPLFKPPRIPHATSLHQALSVPTSKHSCIFTTRIRPTAIPSLVEIGNFQTASPWRWPAVEKHRPVGGRGRPPKLTTPDRIHRAQPHRVYVGLLRHGVKLDGRHEGRQDPCGS